MNILLIIVGIIFGISVIFGAVRGFVKIVASLVSTILILVVVTIASPKVSVVLREMTPLGEIIQTECQDMFFGKDDEQEVTSDAFASREEQILFVEESDVPVFLQDLLLENNNDEIYSLLGVHTFAEYISAYISKIITDILGFLLTLLVVGIVVKSAMYIVGIIGELPVLGSFNHLGGAVLGLGIGLIVVWIVFLVITMLYDTSIGVKCFEDIAESPFLTMLYDSNILIKKIIQF